MHSENFFKCFNFFRYENTYRLCISTHRCMTSHVLECLKLQQKVRLIFGKFLGSLHVCVHQYGHSSVHVGFLQCSEA